MYDVCIIGGGASGMSAAIAAAKRGLSVIIIDKNNKLGKKLYATGNGKCNITNRNMDYKTKYHSMSENYIDFLNKCMGKSPYEDMIEFFNSLGLYTYENGDYVYPNSQQASSVVWAMLDKLKELGVKIVFKEEISTICKVDRGFVVKCVDDEIKASQVVLACGSRSYEKLGGTVEGYKLVRKFEHSIIKVRPALCGMLTEENTESLSGVRVRATASVIINEENISFSEDGELQFTDYGISGILIFNLSSVVGRYLQGNKNVKIRLNLIPHISKEDIIRIYKNADNRTLLGFFNGFVNDKIASFFITKYNLNPKSNLKDIDFNIIMDIFEDISSYQFNINSLCDFDNAQICAGGVDIDEINPNNLMSNKVEDLYLVGEMLDIDGVCGGYNITFAVLSGLRAGNNLKKIV